MTILDNLHDAVRLPLRALITLTMLAAALIAFTAVVVFMQWAWSTTIGFYIISGALLIPLVYGALFLLGAFLENR